MATIQKSFEQIQTDGVMNGSTAFGASQDSNLVDLSLYEGVHFQITADNQAGSPVDSLDIKVFATLDDGVTYDLNPFIYFNIPNAPDPNIISLVVEGYRGIKIQGVRVGTTDTYKVTLKYRRWNYVSV